MDLNSLLIFTRVAENQSFTKAAARLGIEKSTVSSKISELEKRLGVRLLNRNTRSVIMTEPGETYYQYCKNIVERAFEAEEFLKSFHSEPEGLIRLKGPKGIGRILFKDLFSTFLVQYPKINVEVLLTFRDLDMLQHQIDVALTSSRPTNDSGMTAQHILDYNWGYFASADYIAEHGEINTLKQLETHPIILYFSHKQPQSSLYVRKNNKEYFPKYKTRITVNEISPCVMALKLGLGVGIVPTSSVRDEVRTGQLIQVLTSYEMPSGSIYAVYPNREWQTAKLQALLDFLHDWGKKNTG